MTSAAPDSGPPVMWKVGTWGYYYDCFGPLVSGLPVLIKVAMAIWDNGDTNWYLRMLAGWKIHPVDGSDLGVNFSVSATARAPIGIYALCNDGSWYNHYGSNPPFNPSRDTSLLRGVPGGSSVPGNVPIPKSRSAPIYDAYGGRANDALLFTQAPQAVRAWLLPDDGGYEPAGYEGEGWDAVHWVHPDMDGIISPVYANFTDWGCPYGQTVESIAYVDDTHRPV